MTVAERMEHVIGAEKSDVLLRTDFRQVGRASRVSPCLRILCTFWRADVSQYGTPPEDSRVIRDWPAYPDGWPRNADPKALERVGTCCASGPHLIDVIRGSLGQWTLVDFYADWCTSCHHNERSVFGDNNVQAALASVQVLKPDVTANDAQDNELMRRWAVQGLPTMLLIGPDGKERRAQRSVGEMSAAEFLKHLEEAKSS